jgi:serine/threonine protein phosphatase 1
VVTDVQKFTQLSGTRRVWAVASIHGEVDRLTALHGQLWPKLEPGDRVVYLGNQLGRGAAVGETIDELLAFRCAVMALDSAEEPNVVFLRGGQEEMWQKLLQLQFANDPRSVLDWMLEQGVGATLRAYGSSPEEARRYVSSGAVGLTRWTQSLRAKMQARPGHYDFLGALRRAAYTDDGALLFVNAGLDPQRPLEAQKDSFWWAGGGFSRISEPYAGYRRIVRGFDPSHPGLEVTDYTATLDGGCGFGGPLLAMAVMPSGEVAELVEA